MLAIFDLDNTLIDRAASFLRWAVELATVHGRGPADIAWLVEVDGDGFAPRAKFLGAIRDRYEIDLPSTSSGNGSASTANSGGSDGWMRS